VQRASNLFELEVVRAQRPARAGNLQAWARELRYREAERLALRLDADDPDDVGESDERGELAGRGIDVQENEPAARARTRARARGGASKKTPTLTADEALTAVVGKLRTAVAGRARIAAGHTASDVERDLLGQYRQPDLAGRRPDGAQQREIRQFAGLRLRIVAFDHVVGELPHPVGVAARRKALPLPLPNRNSLHS